MGQNRSTAAIGFFQRRPQPKYALLVIAGDNDNALAPRCCLWRRQRGLQWGLDRFAGRPKCRGRRGGRGRNRTTQQSTGWNTKKNNKQCQVVRGGLLRCSLPLLLLWGPLIDRPGSRIVVGGAEANRNDRTVQQSTVGCGGEGGR